MSKEKIGRIAGWEWTEQRPQAIGVFNGQYTIDGQRYFGDMPTPWTVMSAKFYEVFTTHAEALAWAFEKAEAGA